MTLTSNKLYFKALLLDANPRHPLHWGSGNAQLGYQVGEALWMFPKIGGKPPIHLFIGVFHEINHPFWGTTIFGTHIIHEVLFLVYFFVDPLRFLAVYRS